MGGANASAGDLALGTRLYPELPHADGSLQGGNTSSQSALSRSAHSSHARRRLAYERSGTHSEVSLPDLLMDAELDLLERESQSRDESSIESSTAAPKASLDSAVRTPPRALSTKVVPPTPATPFVPGAFPRSRTPTPRRPAVTFEATGPSAPSHPLPRKRLTSHPERWGKDDWRSLDDFFTAQVKHTAQLLMHGAGLSENEARRDAAQNVEAEVVVAAFLHAHGIREEQLEGLWSR